MQFIIRKKNACNSSSMVMHIIINVFLFIIVAMQGITITSLRPRGTCTTSVL